MASLKLVYCVLCFLTTHGVYFTHGVLRPRGVPLSKKFFYDPNQKFNCLDGSGVIPFHFINDDFCDCEDGSDEPGTAACPNGEFICCNHGHLSMTLPSSRVNDGICDCCDTSDEFNSGADCLNNCRELGMQSLNSAKAVLDLYARGNDTRFSYIREASEKREDYQKQLNVLQTKEFELNRIKLHKQDFKERAEERENIFLNIQKQVKQEQERRRLMEIKMLEEQKVRDEMEAAQAFEQLDINKDGKITLSEVKGFSKFDYDSDGQVSEKEAMFYTQKQEVLSHEDFMAHAWRVMKPVFISEEPLSDSNPTFVSASFNSHAVRRDIHADFPDLSEEDKNEVFEEAAISRKEFADANKNLQDVQVDIWNVQKKLTTDYGPENAFLALENLCYDFTETRYLYRLCLFDKAVQILRQNMDETLLGLWESWNGPEGNAHSQIIYTRGSMCWNGPPRSVLVNLKCGLENKLSSVVENNPCVYTFTFETPASCKVIPADVERILNYHIIEL